MRKWWVRFYWCPEKHGSFCLCTPWWETGIGGNEPEYRTICAAIKARDEEHAKEIVVCSFDKLPEDLNFSFVEPRPDDWDPLANEGGRFPPAEWMQECWDRPEYVQEAE